MRKIEFNLILIILIPLFLYSCASAKSALQGQKRSEQSDEFLVEKKNPLAMPPDFDILPAPGNEQALLGEDVDASEIKMLLKIPKKNKDENISENNTDIETSIIEKIQ